MYIARALDRCIRKMYRVLRTSAPEDIWSLACSGKQDHFPRDEQRQALRSFSSQQQVGLLELT